MAHRAGKPEVVVSSQVRSLRAPRKRIGELVSFLARSEGVRIASVDVAIVDRRRIASLHRRYLGRPGATDVISFDLSDDRSVGLCAQVIVCGEVARREAPRHGHGPQIELLLYVLHGMLHLMGYDDTTASAASRMRTRQDELLAAFRHRDRA